MTVAEVEYRLYVPYGWIATEFCDVDFQGDDADTLTSDWRRIQYKKYDQMRSTIDDLNRRVILTNSKIRLINEEYKKSKPWWRFWNTKAEKEMLSRIDCMLNEIDNMNKKIKQAESDRFYTASTLYSKLRSFLLERGFLIQNHNTNGSECQTHIEIWSKQ